MNMLGRTRIGLWAMVLWAGAGVAGGQTAGTAPASVAPNTAAPASAPSTIPSTAPAKKITVDDILASRPPAPFNFTDAKITDIMDYISKSFDLDVVNKYPLTDLLTMKDLGNLKAREAINIINGAILPLGYTVVESVRSGAGGPRVVLTIVPTKVDAGTLVPVFYGNDPAKIPEGEARRTQVLTLHAVDPDKARDMIVSVVGTQAEITLNASTKTIIITDTGTHVHTAAALLQVLEKQAAEQK